MIDKAKKAALAAGKIAISRRFTKHSVKRKGAAGDFSTEADIAAEKKILEILQAEFPQHNFWSEEMGKINNGSKYWWVIDPIDGTGPYFSGLPTFGISIGLLKDKEPILGVLNFPALDSMYWAVRGKGAYKNNKRIKVNKELKLEKVMVGFDFAWMGMRKKEIDSFIRPLADKVRYAPILGCTIAGLAYVAEGTYGGYIHWAYPWDFIAGAAIIKEAGGKVTNLRGQKVNWLDKNMTVVASSGLLHKKLLSLIKK